MGLRAVLPLVSAAKRRNHAFTFISSLSSPSRRGFCSSACVSSKVTTDNKNNSINKSNESSSDHTTINNTVKIPAPTWSVASLELETQHPPVDRETLEILAKRALLDLSQIKSTTESNYDDTIAELQQDVGNMMHMMNQVQLYFANKEGKQQQSPNDDDNHDDDAYEQARQWYDVPRHVQAAPLRSSSSSSSSTNDNDDEDYTQVWESFLAPQTKRVGGHSYFCIPTQRNK